MLSTRSCQQRITPSRSSDPALPRLAWFVRYALSMRLKKIYKLTDGAVNDYRVHGQSQTSEWQPLKT